MSVVIKGLPADHSLSICMGEYVEQTEGQDGRPTFVGGRRNDMVLHFSRCLASWLVRAKEVKSTALLYSIDIGKSGAEALSDLMTSEWLVCEQRKDPSSVRVEKFKKRETMLKLSGGQDFRYGVICEGIYRKLDRIHDGKPTYDKEDNFIWFQEGFGWCLGDEQMIGTPICIMHANDCAPTPDAVQSGWNVRIDSMYDPRVQVVLASAECTPSPSVQQEMPAPARQQELHSAPENTLPPLMVAVVGVDEGLSGLYEKQQDMYDGKVVYKGSRADGNQVIFYSEDVGGQWCIGPLVSDTSINLTMGCVLYAESSASSPHTLGVVWEEDIREPCSSARVTKSKKKHTKIIEVKGVPAHHELLAQMNGKYRQQAHTIDGRPTFKGGDGGNQAIWYSESAGSWRIGEGCFVGTAVYCVQAKDNASMPNAVKSTWEVVNGLLEPNPYAKIILPTFEAAEQEVPRQMQLKMIAVLVAEQKRCLGCGHQYTSQEEVVYHEECMHHHCMCCGEEQGGDTCAVCEAEEGK
jgi:hypothetical protein